ncbi:amidohydrolase family protein [Phenylobacterium sp.]|jgi:predicted amidohydrolase YtcJ|uniref:amidohydrolase family protein n=1 Tax=Phenylobacterium sp. TaxID=1871053 RepID=UPI002F3EE237
MLIRGAELAGGGVADVRVAEGAIAAVAPRLPAEPGEEVIEASGDFLSPGLHDHHIHLMAYAAALDSLACGPPEVFDTAELEAALAAAASGSGWLRGVGYHDSVAGPIDRRWLDVRIPHRPVRIQHRSGRLWIFNSAGLAALGEAGPCETVDGEPTGRLYDGDRWLRGRLAGAPPDIARASRALASYGVTGLTDATPRNGPAERALFDACAARGELLQRMTLMGAEHLDGPRKLHFHDYDLPPLDEVVEIVRASHAAGRTVAAHCVTRVELTFILAALAEAGARPGDRIEHAGVCPPEARDEIARLGLTVVTQPNFIAEKGDDYLAEVDADDQPWLYPAASLIAAGVPLAAGSDAPFGGADPWAAMHAATRRRSRRGQAVGLCEIVTPERALALFTTRPEAPGGAPGRVEAGAPADLCLIDRPWAAAREDLGAVRVRLTLMDGRTTWRAPGDAEAARG